MRRLIVSGLAVAALLGCASIAAPPGGPEDKVPPQLLSVQPESGAVNVKPKNVTFHFDDVINERAGSTGGLSNFFLISPRNGDVEVGWHRSSLDVHPKDGFQANTAYTITMLPGIADLRGNARKEGTSLVFSTGAKIPSTQIAGTIFDWVAGKPMPDAAIEALAEPDTQTVYVAQSDSLGRFTLAHAQPGVYVVRGFMDASHDRTLDPRDAWDTVRVALRDTSRVELLAFVHDTIGPAINAAAIRDSATLQVTFDHGIDPAQTIDTKLFRLLTSDSAQVPIKRVVPAPEWEKEKAHADSLAFADLVARADSLKAKQDTTKNAKRETSKAKPDTSTAKRDTSTAKPDTTRKPDTTHAQPPVPPGGIRLPVPPRAPADTMPKVAAPTPSRPSPITSVVLELGQALQPGKSYRLIDSGVRGLTGASHSTTRVIDVPKTPPPGATVPDSGKAGAPPGAAPAKSGAKKPPVRPPADTSRH